MSLAPTVVTRVRTELEERRRRHRSRRDLRHDLSAYTTQAHVDDLLATLQPFEGKEVEDIRSILIQQAFRRDRGSMPFAS